MLNKPKLSYDWLRFDTNDNCNLNCVYCHNSRSKRLFELPIFKTFLEEKVDELNNFQFGCRMEPTLDNRLIEFMETLHSSNARPTQSIALQTNGTLLHRHDGQRMIDAGLTDIQLSIDTINQNVFGTQRGGAKIGKILNNVTHFSEEFPEVRIKFIVTVSKNNLDYIEELVEFGLSVGVKQFVIREMFHIPGSANVDDQQMSKLVLPKGHFDELNENLSSKFAGQAFLNFIDSKGIFEYNDQVQVHSYPKTSMESQS
ncbi:MAG: radical SAM protein [Mariniblastus sp.]|nr:radical SAM protein [Mariniblastus sp.]